MTVSTASPQLGPSIIRVVTALIVGFVVTQLLRFGVKIDTATAASIVQPAVTAAYYVAVRFLETHVNPKLGVLLGVAKQPMYLDKTGA